VHDLGLHFEQQAEELPGHHKIARRDRAAQLRDTERLNVPGSSKIGHVAFAPGHGPRDEYGLELARIETRAEPYDVFSGTSNVEPVDDANNAKRISNFGLRKSNSSIPVVRLPICDEAAHLSFCAAEACTTAN
jgi:hypothetical protein